MKEILSLGSESFEINDNLKKSFDSDAIFNRDGDFKFNKTGKEIKEKLEGIRTTQAIEVNRCVHALQALQVKIGVVPLGLLDGYEVGKYRHVLKWVPMKYTWEQRRSSNEATASDANTIVSSEEVKSEIPSNSVPSDKEGEASEYNKVANKVGKLMVTMLHISALMNNLKDKSSYKMQVPQLTMLGF